jgi:F-type H+-transporting ATPase subunit b
MAAETQGIGALGIDPVAILLQSGTFLILFFLIKKYALDKIVTGLDERRQKIEQSLAEAEELEKRNASAQADTAALLKEARTEADMIIAKAHEEAGIMVKEAEEAAQKRSDKVVADAEDKLAREVAKAKKDLRGELANLVADATEVIIQEKMTADKDKALIEKTIKQQAGGA